jgi:predicted HTH domain antitoxin
MTAVGIAKYQCGRYTNNMEMSLTLTMPETTDLNPTDMQIFTAAKLYEAQKLSLGQAARAAGLSKRTFGELLGRYGVPLFSQNAEELESDIKNARQLLR